MLVEIDPWKTRMFPYKVACTATVASIALAFRLRHSGSKRKRDLVLYG